MMLKEQTRMTQLSQKYNEFSKVAGLPTKVERLSSGISSKSLTKRTDGGIIKIQSPINSRNSYKGKPKAVYTLDVELNKRQKKLLEKLPKADSHVFVKKSEVTMSDLSALTAKTGVEFAMFSKSGKRLIVRGDNVSVNIDISAAKKLAKAGYRFTGHTHPGDDSNVLIASGDDYEILKTFNQTRSVTYNSKGDFMVYSLEG